MLNAAAGHVSIHYGLRGPSCAVATACASAANGIGDAPTDLGMWEKFQLGWLSTQGAKGPFYEVARAGQRSTHKLGPNTPATKVGGKPALVEIGLGGGNGSDAGHRTSR